MSNLPAAYQAVHSVHWYTDLIHFAPALTPNSLSPSLVFSLFFCLGFRVNMSNSKLHLFYVATETELILEIAILARSLAPPPTAPTDSL